MRASSTWPRHQWSQKVGRLNWWPRCSGSNQEEKGFVSGTKQIFDDVPIGEVNPPRPPPTQRNWGNQGICSAHNTVTNHLSPSRATVCIGMKFLGQHLHFVVASSSCALDWRFCCGLWISFSAFRCEERADAAVKTTGCTLCSGLLWNPWLDFSPRRKIKRFSHFPTLSPLPKLPSALVSFLHDFKRSSRAPDGCEHVLYWQADSLDLASYAAMHN